MEINGAESLSPHELAQELDRGGRVIEFSWCVSLVVITFRRSSTVLVRAGDSALAAGLPYTLLSLVAGWWGFPFGLIFTPIAIGQNLLGGTDHTENVRASLPRPHAQAAPVYGAPPGATYVRVVAPDGTSYPATPLAQDGALVRVRFLDGREEWVPATAVRQQ
jgi:hypothetical protein